jgi:tRNA nucleotidyltransferase/poly(A) polymerase
MPDYIYLLENRLSADQRHALAQLREVARDAGTILFLTGDAVRDLTSGNAVRDLEIAIHGNALKLKKLIEKLGGKVWGEHEASQSLYLCFPGTVRLDVISAHSVTYPKAGKPVYHSASIQEDLRRRDFTVNAMAISLNEGSFGLLMDPLNGAADIESRTLRLVSNYGFIEDPSLMIRAIRYRARLGWEMDLKTRTRYDNAKGEEVIQFLSDHARSKELEEEGWMKALFPAWTSAKADEEKLKALHELAVGLLVQGVHADMSAAQMQLLTAKLAAKDLAAMKKELLRPGFVAEWNSLDAIAAGFQKVLLSKEHAKPSAGYKLFTTYDPEAVLWLGFTSKTASVKDRYEQFLKTWPEARQNIPHALMQEMRITPELPAYNEIVHAVFLELIDGKLTTPEEMRAFLEPHSPPAPPPQVTIKRPRVKRADKIKEQAFDDDEDAEDTPIGDDDLDDIGGDEDEIDLTMNLPKSDLEGDELEPAEDDLDLDDEEAAHPPAKPSGKKSAPPAPARKGAKAAPPAAPIKAEKPAAKPVAEKAAKPEKASPAKTEKAPPVKPEVKAKLAPKPAAKPPAAKANPAPPPPAKAKSAPVKAAKAAKRPAKPAAKAPARPAPKVHPKPAAKAPAKPAAKPSKPAAKKPAPKPAKKR